MTIITNFALQVGTLQVRVRRDADEQMVLAHVHNRLSNLVSELTIQIFKDDWSRSSSVYHLPTTASFSTYPPPMTSTGHNYSRIGSTTDNFYSNNALRTQMMTLGSSWVQLEEWLSLLTKNLIWLAIFQPQKAVNSPF